MELPTLLEKTERTRTVQVGGEVFKVKKRRAGRGSWKRGSQSLVSGWVWDCSELGLKGVTRLQAETALLRKAGNPVELLTESVEGFVL